MERVGCVVIGGSFTGASMNVRAIVGSSTDCLHVSAYFAEKDDCSLTDNMEGSYTYTSSEGFDEFLGKRGVPWIVRKMILAAPVELQVSLHCCSTCFHCVIDFCCHVLHVPTVLCQGFTWGTVDNGL